MAPCQISRSIIDDKVYYLRNHVFSSYPITSFSLQTDPQVRQATIGEWILKLLFVFSCMIITVVLIIHKYQSLSNFKKALYYRYVSEESFFNGSPRNVDRVRVDWHDYAYIEYEAEREGPGEHGKPLKLEKPEDIKLNEKLFKENGYSAVISDMIPLNRSVPDIRHAQ